MAASTRTYEIRSTFRAPLPFVFAWCTDYSSQDGKLEKEEYERRVVQRKGRRVVYEDLEETPGGWAWSRHTVTLQQPNRWRSDSTGNYRHWKLQYSLRSLPDGRTELTLRGVRRPVGLMGRNPPKLQMERSMRQSWKNFGRALERDYRRSRSGGGTAPKRAA